jgi:hypothetical protein
LRLLPSIDALLAFGNRKPFTETSAKHLTVLARAVIDSLRREIQEKIAEDLSKAEGFRVRTY